MPAKKSGLRPRELCGERRQLAAQYLVADTAYTKNLDSMKEAPEDLGPTENRIMDDLRLFRDITLRALLAHTVEHRC
jgi:hypothetical protein